MENIVLQISVQQNGGTERYIVNYKDLSGNFKQAVINISILTVAEKAVYDNFKMQAQSKAI